LLDRSKTHTSVLIKKRFSDYFDFGDFGPSSRWAWGVLPVGDNNIEIAMVERTLSTVPLLTFCYLDDTLQLPCRAIEMASAY